MSGRQGTFTQLTGMGHFTGSCPKLLGSTNTDVITIIGTNNESRAA